MLRAGFAKADITPGRDLSLMGYEFREESLWPGNDGPRDPLYARALVFDGGAGPAAIVALDLAVVSLALAQALRRAVAEAVGSDPERVIIACIHTHSGPHLQEFKFTDAGLAETVA